MIRLLSTTHYIEVAVVMQPSFDKSFTFAEIRNDISKKPEERDGPDIL